MLDKQFMDLIEQNKALILKICLFYTNTEADRQDLFQDIILQAWKSYPGFRNESKFSTWLYRVSLNTALLSIRKQEAVTQLHFEETGNGAFQTPEYESDDRLRAAIKTLNEIEKSLVLLYLDGYNYEEMEKITGISAGALRVKMSRVKQKLKTAIN